MCLHYIHRIIKRVYTIYSQDNKTCLHYLAYFGCLDDVKLLVEAGGKDLLMVKSEVNQSHNLIKSHNKHLI